MQRKTFDGTHRGIAMAGLAIALILFSGAPVSAENRSSAYGIALRSHSSEGSSTDKDVPCEPASEAA